MGLYRYIFAALLFFVPLAVSAATEPAATAIPESESIVEEPDAPDALEENVQPKNLPPVPDVKENKPFVPPTAPQPGPGGETGFNTVILHGLNKVTARPQVIEATIGSVVRFGTIEIVAHSCWKSSPEDRPENAALLEVSEIKPGATPARIFLGWMFSSSPGLSSLEHPFYDITVVECKKKELKD